MELVIKVLLCFSVLWILYEILQVDYLINYPRLSHFLRSVYVTTLIYTGLYFIIALFEHLWHLSFEYYLSLIANLMFFISVAVIIRLRRHKLAKEWEDVPEDNTKIYKEIIGILEITKQELTKIT